MDVKDEYEKWFLNTSEKSAKAFSELMDSTINLISEELMAARQPFSGSPRHEIRSLISKISKIPAEGEDMVDVMRDVGDGIIRNSMNVSDPSAMAHLHCPPLIPSVAAETLIGAMNQSMDSWDQSPAATYVEEEMIRFFRERIGYGESADGVFTCGGTQSNYMGMLLARNRACSTHFNVDVHREGLPSDARKLRILCSEHAHFSVQKSSARLGLGTDAVVTVKADSRGRLSMEDAEERLKEMHLEGSIPFMVVATAGTTDFGSIDDLESIAALADAHRLWMHVDAAYGGALLFSHDYAHYLEYICNADSVAVDFHKLFYQTISCGAFFVKDRDSFTLIAHHADYLNPEEDDTGGIPNLVGKSVQTSRRFDALKILMTFKLMGTDAFGDIIDHTIHLAEETTERLYDFGFEVPRRPVINTVLFRYIPEEAMSPVQIDKINGEIQSHFYRNGELIMAKTKHDGSVFLKFTMLNPLNSSARMESHIREMKRVAAHIEQREKEEAYGYSLHS